MDAVVYLVLAVLLVPMLGTALAMAIGVSTYLDGRRGRAVPRGGAVLDAMRAIASALGHSVDLSREPSMRTPAWSGAHERRQRERRHGERRAHERRRRLRARAVERRRGDQRERERRAGAGR